MTNGFNASATVDRSENLRSQVYNDLRDKIRHGRIGPEDRLIDVKIAKSLGISRMPVREALLQLISEGHLVGTTRGFALPQLTAQDIRDIFEVRKLLEPRAAASATRDLDGRGIAVLKRALDRATEAVEAGNAEELAAANITFRRTWLDANRNRRLAETISRFADQTHIVRDKTLTDSETRLIVRDGLAGLYEAFSRGDAIAAHDRMFAFIGEAEKSYFRAIAADRRFPAASDTPSEQSERG